MCKISIIIPVYNAEHYLAETLDSVLKQSLHDIEIICVNDGSTDSSLEILSAYAFKDKRVKILTQENQHAGVARNNGLAAAAGEFVHFLDADDYVFDYAYEALYCKAVKNDLDMLHFAALDWDVQRKCYVDIPDDSLSALRPDDFHRLLDPGQEESPLFHISVAPWAGLYRRSFLIQNKITFGNYEAVEDRLFYAAVITHAQRIMIARDRLVFHRVNQSASIMGQHSLHFECHYLSICLISEQMSRDKIDLSVQKHVLRAEFEDLFAWYLEFCSKLSPQTENYQRIADETAHFAESYTGPYAYLLREKYLQSLERLSHHDGLAMPFPVITPMHDECPAPKVSVVVPVYNAEDHLNETLNSLTAQELQEMEFVFVNVGSADSSIIIIKEYAAVDRRICILDDLKGNYGKALNLGIDAAKGKYIGILEPGDAVPSSMYRELYKTAQRKKADIALAGYSEFSFNMDGSRQENPIWPTRDKTLYNRIVTPVREVRTFLFPAQAGSGIYRTDFLRSNRIRYSETPEHACRDFGFWFRAFCCAQRAIFIDCIYCRKRRDNPGTFITSKNEIYCITEEFQLIQQFLKRDEEMAEKLYPIFCTREAMCLLDTYYCLSPQLQREFLYYVRAEMDEPLKAGLIDKKFLGNFRWEQLKRMVDDPDQYLDEPSVSVIIPVDNAAGYVRQTLNSLLYGGNSISFEVICIDDGSTENSPGLLREYAQKDSRVSVITLMSSNAEPAENRGLHLAKGEYLLFPDAGDCYEPHMLDKAYECARALHTDITIFQRGECSEDTDTFFCDDKMAESCSFPVDEPFAGDDIESGIFQAMSAGTGNKLFRTAFIRENRLQFLKKRTANGLHFVCSAIVKAGRISAMKDVLVHHERPDETMSADNNSDFFYHELLALRKQLQSWGIYEERERDFINCSLSYSLWNLDTHQGDAYRWLYMHLKEEWLADLGITSHGADYYYSAEDYQSLQSLLDSDNAEDYLHFKLESMYRQIAGEQEVNEDLLYHRSVRDRHKAAARRVLRRIARALPDALRVPLLKRYKMRYEGKI